jgi:apolipoprotein N-acyltransferase
MRLRSIALVVVAALLYFAAYPPLSLWPFAFVWGVPFALALEGRKLRHAAWLGALSGALAWGAGATFIVDVARTFGPWPLPAALLAYAVFVLVHAQMFVAVAIVAAALRRARTPWALALPVAHALAERLTPRLFDAYTAAQLLEAPLGLVQVVDVVGPVGAGALVVACSGALADAVLALRARPMHRAFAGVTATALAFAVAVPIGMAAYGTAKQRWLREEAGVAPSAFVGIVQGGRRPGEPHTLPARYLALSRELVGNGRVDLLLWPETALGDVLSDRDARQVMASYAAQIGPFGGHWITGALVARDAKDPSSGRPRFAVQNVAAHLAPAANAVSEDASARSAHGAAHDVDRIAFYAKVHPLLFGETLPKRGPFALLRRVLPNAGDLEEGDGPRAMTVSGHSVAPLICYEDLLPDYARNVVRETAAELLVVLSDDAWFGETSARALHTALARLRAVETGRFVVRATTTGPSVVIDPRGVIVAATRDAGEATLRAEVSFLAHETLYARFGDAILVAVAVAVACAALLVHLAIARRAFASAQVDVCRRMSE